MEQWHIERRAVVVEKLRIIVLWQHSVEAMWLKGSRLVFEHHHERVLDLCEQKDAMHCRLALN